jgi:hypothetical protein
MQRSKTSYDWQGLVVLDARLILGHAIAPFAN